ncbi:ester cyclase [Enterococcus wangshanyuanii]|nr:ester cyclase [Enterococcus wangshanyuanii]
MKKPKEIVEDFFRNVRSGNNLETAHKYMHEYVIAHQVQSEDEYIIERSPQDYIEHVKEMQDIYGQFQLEIQELLADGNRVYIRWKQVGTTSDGKQVIQIASAVYLVESEKISEYWIQIDRKGLELQK